MKSKETQSILGRIYGQIHLAEGDVHRVLIENGIGVVTIDWASFRRETDGVKVKIRTEASTDEAGNPVQLRFWQRTLGLTVFEACEPADYAGPEPQLSLR